MLGQGHHESDTKQAGFTLIELVVVMSIASVLLGLGVFGFTSWRLTAQQQGTASELTSTLRNASVRAVSEGRTYCVSISAGTSYVLWKYTCGTGTQVAGPFRVQSNKVLLTTTATLPSPAPACPEAQSCLYFYPRGTAIPATVTVTSTARSKVYRVNVEGLTSRVYM